MDAESPEGTEEDGRTRSYRHIEFVHPSSVVVLPLPPVSVLYVEPCRVETVVDYAQHRPLVH